jgi:hypothetical protein
MDLVRKKTPKSFIKACDKFIYTEIFKKKENVPSKITPAAKLIPLRDFSKDDVFKAALDQSVDAAMTDSGRANLATVGSHLSKLLPDFDSRNYGFLNLSGLVEKIPNLKATREKMPSGLQIVFVQRK